MIPAAPKVLGALAGALGTQVMQEVQTPFGQQTVGLGTALLIFLAQDFDRAAARYIEETAAGRELLTRARNVVTDESLVARIAEVEAMPPPTDFLVSALEVTNNAVRRVLIDVHAAVEEAPGSEAALLNQAIWDELRQSTRRRHLESPLG